MFASYARKPVKQALRSLQRTFFQVEPSLLGLYAKHMEQAARNREDIATTFSCAICKVSLTPDRATAGLLDGKGCQAFACVSHFSEVEKLISGWADFMAVERYKYLREAQEPQALIYGADRLARFDS